MKHIALIVTLTLTTAAQAGDWLQFRGPNGAGVVEDSTLPIKLTKNNLKWSIDLPGRGLSGAIVVGDRVFVTCSSGSRQNRLHVVCLNARDGSTRWHRQFWATGRTMCHSKTSVAGPTPCSDGKRIFANFSSNDLVCLDLDGNLQWLRGLTHDYRNVSNSLGMASSLVIVDKVLVVPVENDSESYTIGISRDTGRNLWKLDRPKAANWSSPVVLWGAYKGRDLVALQSSKGVRAIDTKNGDMIWDFTNGASTTASTCVHDGVLYVPSNGITALRPRSDGNTPDEVWQSGQLQPATASPIVLGKNVFTVNRAGVLTAGSLETGKRKWQLRLKGPFSSTPVATGKHVFIFNEAGLMQVVDTTTKEGEVVGKLNLDDQILATPAVANGAIYVRSNTKIYKVAR
jgi:outer membrane protein assembly factor BamB